MDINENNKITWSLIFFSELRNICNYISYTRNEYIIANRLYSKIINKIETLEVFPERYPKISNANNLRKMLFKKFVIIYEYKEEKKEILILHIFRDNQNYLDRL